MSSPPPPPPSTGFKSPLQQSYLEKKALFKQEADKLSDTINKLKTSSASASASTATAHKENADDDSNYRWREQEETHHHQQQQQQQAIDAEQYRLDGLHRELALCCGEEEALAKQHATRAEDLQQAWDGLAR